eukprot:CAMPEP_0196584972 /NCGR_PEP_ID=MMETSP1081-20130531/49187_1 /TAXON_ID=36882 /ORGANISM="Pyramimonas amylifera, Strain CCMP720" /LENGTH=78 /DNA_ID=CAMNT_0041906367 /DNA_START=171 /DNA_END=407 /DNA_ORIENTATION=+
MRPGETATLPVQASGGALFYVLEGVALLDTEIMEETCYANEGHGVWLPPQISKNDDEVTEIRVRTHMWSSARFVVLSA